jgi:hypothetical protein
MQSGPRTRGAATTCEGYCGNEFETWKSKRGKGGGGLVYISEPACWDSIKAGIHQPYIAEIEEKETRRLQDVTGGFNEKHINDRLTKRARQSQA